MEEHVIAYEPEVDLYTVRAITDVSPARFEKIAIVYDLTDALEICHYLNSDEFIHHNMRDDLR